jgi:hypothetical protein
MFVKVRVRCLATERAAKRRRIMLEFIMSGVRAERSLAVPIRKSKFQLYTMADAEKPTVIDTSEKKDLLPEADLTKYKVGQALIC